MAVSPEKKQIIKESVRRLLDLGIPDREIIDNLKSVGIDEQLGRDVLRETKDESSPKPATQQEKPAGREKAQQPRPAVKASEESHADEIADDLYGKVYDEDDKGKLRTPVIRKAINNPQYEPAVASQKTAQQAGQKAQARQAQQTVQKPAQAAQKAVQAENFSGSGPGHERDEGESQNLAELWEKGILTTVNARLSEMKQMRDGLDALIDQKISERVKMESRKIETVLDSQRTLFYSKIDAHLDAKADELKRVLESRAKQLEDVNAKVQQQLAQAQAEKKFTAELLNSLNEKIATIDSTRSQMLSETNSSLISMESKFNQFMSESGRKRDEAEQRIKSALQLESSITEGMVENVKQMMEKMRLEKENEFTEQVKERLKELDEAAAKVDPEGITEKVAEMNALAEKLSKKDKELDLKFDRKSSDLDKETGQHLDEFRKDMAAFRREVAKMESDNLADLKKMYAANVDELFAEHLGAWNKAIAEKKKEMDSLKAGVDIEKYNDTLDALDEFKEQFLDTVKKSIQDYNKSKKELAESIIERDRTINEYLKRIDAKMQELSEFQKGFSKDVADLLGKIPREGEREKGRKQK